MRAGIIGLLLGALLLATPAAAYDANDPANCLGADWDEAQPLTVRESDSGQLRQKPLR